MTQNKEVSIEQMDLVIAKFMGIKSLPDGWIVVNGREYALSGRYFPKHLKYNRSWSWLMPVVEKIGSTTVKSSAAYNPDLMFRIKIVNGYTEIEGTPERIFYNSSVEGSMINATHKAVYHFITWYNTTLKKHQ